MESNPKRTIPGVKDGTGAFLPPERPEPPARLGGLDEILKRQLLALERVTIQLVTRSSSLSGLTKAEIDSLATCIDITLKLKAKEKDLLGALDEDALLLIASKAE